MEVLVLNELAKNGGRHFCKIVGKVLYSSVIDRPHIVSQGCYRNFNYVVMTFVGMSLADLRLLAPTKKFSYGTAMSVGIQCLEALEVYCRKQQRRSGERTVSIGILYLSIDRISMESAIFIEMSNRAITPLEELLWMNYARYGRTRYGINVIDHSQVYVLDFGMARKFIKDDGKTMRSPRDNAGFR